MSLPFGYFYSNGWVWKNDGTGPYFVTPAGTTVPLNLCGQSDVVHVGMLYLNPKGLNWTADPAGPYNII